MSTPARQINPLRLASATRKSKCIKSKNGNHQWKEIGEVPGAQEQCIYCNAIVTWKT